MRPLSLPRSAAYARRHPEAEELVGPAGAFDVARDIPPVDLNLVAPATNLVTREDLHPAAIGILLEAAREIHRSPTLFAPEGTFPSSRYVSLSLNAAALRYYEDGVGTLNVPRTRVAPYFEFRQNVHDVRERLKTI